MSSRLGTILTRHPLRSLGAALGILFGGAAAIAVDAVGARVPALAIAGAALLVGAAGIGSALSLDLLERTGELGLRMVLGATPGRIRAHVLVEGARLALLGGVAGALLGWGVVKLVSMQLPQVLRARADALAALPLLALTVGIVAGLGPARRAARIDPAQLLRRG